MKLKYKAKRYDYKGMLIVYLSYAHTCFSYVMSYHALIFKALEDEFGEEREI